MKRSDINRAFRQASAFFDKCAWSLPPDPRWDITDLGLGDYWNCGLALVNLCEEPEYCEKIMYAVAKQVTPAHHHRKKKEDIICRSGELAVRVWQDDRESLKIRVNGNEREVRCHEVIRLASGERVTLEPLVWHEFWPESDECLIGEVSTANDDLGDNFFLNPDVGRFPEIEEDEPAELRLISETQTNG